MEAKLFSKGSKLEGTYLFLGFLEVYTNIGFFRTHLPGFVKHIKLTPEFILIDTDRYIHIIIYKHRKE